MLPGPSQPHSITSPMQWQGNITENWGFPGGSSGLKKKQKQKQNQKPACQCRRQDIWVRSLGLEDLLDGRAWQSTPVFLPREVHRGAWQATVHRVAQSWTQLKWLHTHTHITTNYVSKTFFNKSLGIPKTTRNKNRHHRKAYPDTQLQQIITVQPLARYATSHQRPTYLSFILSSSQYFAFSKKLGKTKEDKAAQKEQISELDSNMIKEINRWAT